LNFSRIYLYKCEHLKEIGQVKKFRRNKKIFADSLILITKHLIISAYQNIISGQDISCLQQKGKICLEKAKKKIMKFY